jgi:translation initiation factor 2 subunit 3
MDEDYSRLQPEVNIGTLGHVDNGKSTIVQALTGVWTGKHSEELRRGITIRVGYADTTFYKCPKCGPPMCYTTEKKCRICNSETKLQRLISFVDCPGHHSLMVTMLSGATLMDGALFIIAANAKCPQAQDREHLIAAEIAGIKNLIVVQNKIDLVDKEHALKNYEQIKGFVKGTIAENAPVIPISAQHKINLDVLLEAMDKVIPTPKRDPTAPPKMYVLRSFDVNKPGTEVDDLVGGVIGGSVTQGVFKTGDEIEMRPGLRIEKGGRIRYEPIFTTIRSLYVGSGSVEQVKPGGLVGIGTSLDPALTKSDGMVGSIVGRTGTLPETLDKLTLEVQLLERAVGTEMQVTVDKIKTNEALVLNVFTTVTSGIVSSAREQVIDVALKNPVCVEKNSKVAISRRIGDGWRLIGFGTVK